MFTDSELIEGSKYLSHFALRLAGNTDRAKDLVQDTLLKALENRDQFRTGSNIKGWLGRIMYTVFVTQYNRRIKFDAQYYEEQDFLNIPERATQEDQLFVRQALEHIDSLKPHFREILNLLGEGVEYEDIAQELDIPLGTVRSRISRARAAAESARFNPDIRQMGVA